MADAHRPSYSFESHRGSSNSGNSRFNKFGGSRSSFSHSRREQNDWLSQNSGFRGAHRFESGGTNFDRGSSFGANDFSFFPDLFGLALNLGTFGLRGFGLLGLGLTGLNLLDSVSGDFGSDANQTSPYLGFGPDPYAIPYPSPYSAQAPNPSSYPLYPVENLPYPKRR